MILRCHVWHRFFDAMSGVKKLMYFHAVITYPTWAFEASNDVYIQTQVVVVKTIS